MVRNVARAMSGIAGLWCFMASAVDAQWTGGESCRGVRWSAPAEWRSREGDVLYLSMPFIAPVHGGSTLWLGQILLIRKGPSDFRWPFAPPGAAAPGSWSRIQIGAMVGRDGSLRYVPMPADQVSGMTSPRYAVDARGIVHVMWAPSDSNRPRQVLYATFDGVRWSAPRAVAENRRFFWDFANTSPLVVQNDTVHQLVNASDGLLYIRGTHGLWLTRQVEGLQGGAVTRGYPRLTVMPNGRLVLVVQGAAQDAPERSKLTSRVYATWSDDQGASWARLTPVSDLRMEPAFDFHVLQAADGVLRILWYQPTDTSGSPSQSVSLSGSPGRVHIAESRDGGESWHALPASQLLRYAESLDAAPLDDSTVVVALVDRQAEEVLLTTWSRGWRPFSHIDAGPNPQQTVLGRDDAQRLVLTWGSEQGSPRRSLSMVSTLTPCR